MNKDYKNLCQVFTPEKNVKELLDWCGYVNNLYGKKIIENSCGDGHILEEVVRRYIKFGIKNKFNVNKIRNGIANDICGIEYDPEQRRKCIINLERIAMEYNISKINWGNIIKEQDTLKNIEKEQFDFVVGNPPYIKYKSLGIDDREYIRNHFETCKNGKFDYCYAFIEASVQSLKDDGKMAYLIPSSIFKNVFANDLRKYIKPYLLKIYDYTTTKLFDKDSNAEARERMTSSSVIILNKNAKKEFIEYINVTNGENVKINKDNLTDKWIFRQKSVVDGKINEFKKYFYASNTIATLCNDVYVISKFEENKKYIITENGDYIEKEVLKNTISPKYFDKDINEKIIFPYSYGDDNKLIRYDDKEFKKKFKRASDYLKKNMELLNKRCSDKNAKWFEYGRSQALKNSNQEKLLLSTVITNKVKTKRLPASNIPYSGIYIIKIGNKSLAYADKILHSDEFFEYIKEKGINASGNSLRITAKDINEYRF